LRDRRGTKLASLSRQKLSSSQGGEAGLRQNPLHGPPTRTHSDRGSRSRRPGQPWDQAPDDRGGCSRFLSARSAVSLLGGGTEPSRSTSWSRLSQAWRRCSLPPRAPVLPAADGRSTGSRPPRGSRSSSRIGGGRRPAVRRRAFGRFAAPFSGSLLCPKPSSCPGGPHARTDPRRRRAPGVRPSKRLVAVRRERAARRARASPPLPRRPFPARRRGLSRGSLWVAGWRCDRDSAPGPWPRLDRRPP
jgi:hypothetical protein